MGEFVIGYSLFPCSALPADKGAGGAVTLILLLAGYIGDLLARFSELGGAR